MASPGGGCRVFPLPGSTTQPENPLLANFQFGHPAAFGTGVFVARSQVVPSGGMQAPPQPSVSGPHLAPSHFGTQQILAFVHTAGSVHPGQSFPGQLLA